MMIKTSPSDISKRYVGQQIDVYGLVLHVRDLGRKKFIIITDGKSILQIVYSGSEKVRRGDTIRASGIIKEDPRAPTGLEMVANN
ncbi:MAG TPA: hypothetical protein EYH09_01910, partial [Candidatus Nanopusillus sp.]|nr:hypothetical protein [Candidatus Nanopusillus sp.]